MSRIQTGRGDKFAIKNMLLLALVVALAVITLFTSKGADFGGADGKAEAVINEISPGYTPWLESIWEPPSGEIESLLFVVQGALGAGFIGYCLGYFKGRRKRED